MWGFQIWVNLPADKKMMAPRYQDIPPEGIPSVTPVEGVEVRVLAGAFAGTEGPVQGIATQPLFLDVTVAPDARCDIPVTPGHTALLYVFEGALTPAPGHASLARGQLVVYGDGARVQLEGGASGGRCILLAGAPLREPVARHGPFVMNTRQELVQAFEDYRAGRLA